MSDLAKRIEKIEALNRLDLTWEKFIRAVSPCFPPTRRGPLVGIAPWAQQMLEERAKAGLYMNVRRDDGIVKTEYGP